ncbi:DUF2993 domain-containing protein [Ancylothrix sp. C2]|uniref:LmeA family phospholipid-binding protein n=1 Tax=Ancylothrix sp. D3o TaxID=2953691 RepID=UPI0021BB83B5|nr:DUF2993 domain-containing protein [Ancylothrix sp. D3o]MCT7949408.1 DUF2993 domain-containing protein [Ancylothrix sp. D3o]
MEILSILLSLILTIISPVGFIADSAAEKAIRNQLESVEQLQVRIDNTPSFQLIQGKVDRIRIAGRGLYLKQDIRIDTLEIETDPLNIDIQKLRQSRQNLDLSALKSPLNAGIRIVLTPEDINRALQSPQITNRLKNLTTSIADLAQTEQIQRYEILNPRLEFLENNRLKLLVEIQEKGYPERLNLDIETALTLNQGKLQLTDLSILANNEPAPPRLVNTLTQRINSRLDIQNIQNTQILLRFLKLNLTPEQLEIAAFVQAKPNPQTGN